MHTLNKRKLLFDGILISVLLLAALAAFLIIRAASKPGSSVRISVNGEITEEYPLSVNAEYELSDGENILVIENGEAYVRWASCPDKVCVNSGRISRTGERIVCLPNRVEIRVVGESDEIFSQ